MRTKRRVFQHSNTQGYPLREHIDLRHPLIELADMIDWGAIDRVASEPVQPGPGRPILLPRLIAGLLYLQHAFNLSDEQVVAGWLENPYWQMFTGETHLQTEPPIDPSSLSRWRKRLGEVGMEELLAQSIEAAKRANVIKPSSVQREIVDTTVIEKAIAYPTDSALLERSREHLVKRHGNVACTYARTTTVKRPGWCGRLAAMRMPNSSGACVRPCVPCARGRASSPRYRASARPGFSTSAQGAR